MGLGILIWTKRTQGSNGEYRAPPIFRPYELDSMPNHGQAEKHAKDNACRERGYVAIVAIGGVSRNSRYASTLQIIVERHFPYDERDSHSRGCLKDQVVNNRIGSACKESVGGGREQQRVETISNYQYKYYLGD